MSAAHEILAAVGEEATIHVRRPSLLARAVGSARAGRAVGIELVVGDARGDRRPFLVTLPDASDLVAPAIADAILAAIAIRRRFPDHLRSFKRISFDHSEATLVAGELAGHAVANRSTIHLNASYVIASEVDGLTQRWGRHALVPMRRLVAHELWHLIELTWEVRDYAATIEFRRRLGEHFGVVTVERAILEPVARERLVAEVSGYAATGRLEATAEMFERWWNEGAVTPALDTFGALVLRCLPPPEA